MDSSDCKMITFSDYQNVKIWGGGCLGEVFWARCCSNRCSESSFPHKSRFDSTILLSLNFSTNPSTIAAMLTSNCDSYSITRINQCVIFENKIVRPTFLKPTVAHQPFWCQHQFLFQPSHQRLDLVRTQILAKLQQFWKKQQSKPLQKSRKFTVSPSTTRY